MVDQMSFSPPGSVVLLYSSYEGTGKTVLASQLAMHEARRGEVVVFASLEVIKEQFLALTVAQTVGPLRDEGFDRTGKVKKEDKLETVGIIGRTYQAEGDVKERLHMDEGRLDQPLRMYVGYSLDANSRDELEAFLDNTCQVTGCTRFILDTFHRVALQAKGESEVDATGKTIKMFERLAKKYGAVFIVIAQANKQAQNLDNKKRDEEGVLRGSKELKDVATAIYLLHRKYKDKAEGGGLENRAMLIEQKKRYGGPVTGAVMLEYIWKHSKFGESTSNGEAPKGPASEESVDGL
jgi:KaiC/GvpD/RAD55 family RecA-like ATPase